MNKPKIVLDGGQLGLNRNYSEFLKENIFVDKYISEKIDLFFKNKNTLNSKDLNILSDKV